MLHRHKLIKLEKEEVTVSMWKIFLNAKVYIRIDVNTFVIEILLKNIPMIFGNQTRMVR